MKYISNFYGRLAALLIVCALSAACADRQDENYAGAENRSLKEWMKIHHPELLGNYQSDGGYYVDIVNPGDPDAKTVNDTICWVRFELTGRSLAGNVCLTRNELTARQLGTFTRYTHYVPFYKYCGQYTGALIDGVHAALRDTLTLDPAYAVEHGLKSEFCARLGTEMTVYMPSTVVGSGLSGSGGYEGQPFGDESYSLDANRPLIAHLKVTDIVKNPVEAEGGEVDAFATENGGLKPADKKEEKTASATRGREEPQYNDGYAWRNSVDSIPQLYVSHTFAPSLRADSLLRYRNTYRSSVTPYDNMTALDEKINRALIDRFGYGTLEGDSVKLDGTAKIWYIGRFLDGFIFDTNIDEVKELIYRTPISSDMESSYIAYKPEEDMNTYIKAWYYTIPQLRYGQWAALVAASDTCYGATGQEGRTTTSTSGGYDTSYYDMLNYYNYMNAMYGNSYYGSYYNNYYNNYYGGYYGGYYGYDYGYDTSTSTTTTTVSTEIQSYTPLIFEIYIEPKEKD